MVSYQLPTIIKYGLLYLCHLLINSFTVRVATSNVRDYLDFNSTEQDANLLPQEQMLQFLPK
jgi:hypothetical protein